MRINLIIATIIGGVFGFGASYAFFLPKIAELHEQIEMRPPVLVIDMAKLALEAVPMGAGQEAINEHFKNTQAIIDSFKKAGYLILPRENVINAPKDLMLNKSDLPGNIYLELSGEDENE